MVNIASETPYTEAPNITTTPHKNHIYNLPTYFEDRIEKMIVNNRMSIKMEAEKIETETKIEQNIYDIKYSHYFKNTKICTSTAPTPNVKLKLIFE